MISSSTLDDSSDSIESEEQDLLLAADEFRRRLIKKGDQATSNQFEPARIAAVLRLLRATVGDHSTRSMRAADRRELPVNLPQRIGRFVMGELVGKGGFGVVHRAHDEVLHRDVAIKVILKSVIGQSLKDEDRVREARSAAKLNHPYLVPLYEVLDDDKHLYLVSEFCEGPTLYQFLLNFKDGLPPSQSVEIAVKLGQAIAHAHGRGLAHRDIKPGNVILPDDDAYARELGPSDEQSPKLPFAPRLTDFGLVLDLDSERDLGREGRLTGTILYMAPEQIMGTVDIDPRRSDIYSLGLLLHQMLTGRLPHQSDSTLTLLEDTCTNELKEVRTSQGAVSRDLEAVCLKALRKNPAQRYESAKQFVDDLVRWQEGREVTARKRPWYERGYCLAKEAPLTTALIVSFVGLAISSSVYFAASNRRLNLQSQGLTLAVEKAKAAELKAIEGAYRSDISQAFSAIAQNNASTALERAREIDDYVPAPMKQRLGLRVVKTLSQAGWSTVDMFDSSIQEIVAVPGTNEFLVAAEGPEVRVYEGVSGGLIEKLKLPEGSLVHALAISSDAKQVAVGLSIPAKYFWSSDDAQVRLFSRKNFDENFESTGKPLTGFVATIDSLAFSVDSQQLVVGTRYEPLDLFTMDKDSQFIRNAKRDRLPATRRNEDLSFVSRPPAKPSGMVSDEVAWMPKTDEIRLFDVASSKIVHQIFIETGHSLRRLTRSIDGRFIAATLQASGEGLLFQVPPSSDTSQPVKRFKLDSNHGELWSIRISDDGRYVVAGTMGGGVVLWDLFEYLDDNGVLSLKDGAKIPLTKFSVLHREPVFAIDVNEQGRIVSGSRDGSVVASHAEENIEAQSNIVLENQSRAADLSPDARSVVIGCNDGSVWRVDIATGSRKLLRSADQKEVTDLAISPDGKIITIGLRGGMVMFTRQNPMTVTSMGQVDTPSKQKVDEWSDADELDWIELPIPAAVSGHELNERMDVDRIRYTPSSKRVCICRSRSHVQWVSLTLPNPTAHPNYHGPTSVDDICIIDEETVLAVGERMRFIDRERTTVQQSFPGFTHTNCQVFDRVNGVIYLGGADGRIRAITPAGKLLRKSRRWAPDYVKIAGNRKIKAIALSPDGANLLTGSDSGDVAIWETSKLRCLGAIWRGEQSHPIEQLDVSRDGNLIMAHECGEGSMDKQNMGRVRLIRLSMQNSVK